MCSAVVSSCKILHVLKEIDSVRRALATPSPLPFIKERG